MENLKSGKGGVNREHGSSRAEKTTFSMGHLGHYSRLFLACLW